MSYRNKCFRRLEKLLHSPPQSAFAFVEQTLSLRVNQVKPWELVSEELGDLTLGVADGKSLRKGGQVGHAVQQVVPVAWNKVPASESLAEVVRECHGYFTQ